MHRDNLAVLTSLRFFAAAAVVVFHYDLGRNAFPQWASGFGNEAVTFFFILSGFILSYAHCHLDSAGTARLNINDSRFMALRCARILPAYALALALALPFFVHQHLLSPTADPASFLTGLILVPLLLQAWIPDAAQLWNMPAWSLSVELFFYATLPFLIRATGSLAAPRLVLLACVGVVAMQLVRVALQHQLEGQLSPQTHHNFIKYFPLFHWPQFLLGVALGRLFSERRQRPRNSNDVALGMALIGVAAAVYFNPHHEWIGSSTVLAAIFAPLILAAAGASGPRLSLLASMLSSRPLVLLGEASYAIYILHIPILMWWSRLMSDVLGLTLPPALNFCAYAGVVVATSVLCLNLVEKPARAWLLGRLEPIAARIHRPRQSKTVNAA